MTNIKKWKICQTCQKVNGQGYCKEKITPNAKDGKRRRGTACFYYKEGGISNEKLKPCPFCGTIPSVRTSTSGRYYVMCHEEKCLMHVVTSTYYVKPESAIAAWNKRTDNGGD